MNGLREYGSAQGDNVRIFRRTIWLQSEFQPQGKRMKIAVRALASLLLCAAAFPACANPMQPAGTSPTASELAQWKKDVLTATSRLST